MCIYAYAFAFVHSISFFIVSYECSHILGPWVSLLVLRFGALIQCRLPAGWQDGDEADFGSWTGVELQVEDGR